MLVVTWHADGVPLLSSARNAGAQCMIDHLTSVSCSPVLAQSFLIWLVWAYFHSARLCTGIDHKPATSGTTRQDPQHIVTSSLLLIPVGISMWLRTAQ